MITWLAPGDRSPWFPPVDDALEDPPGLLAAGGDLSSERLIAAYRRGIFPWYSAGQPVLWWCPDPRAVLFPAEFRRSRSLGKTERNTDRVVRFDTAFAQVLTGCAAPRGADSGTWITPDMRTAYLELHRLGIAHSVEVWQRDRLVGGLYGVSLGRVFFGESMFSIERDASKMAFSALIRMGLECGLALVDCQLASRHLQSLGSRTISRGEFSALLAQHAGPDVPTAWVGRSAGQNPAVPRN